MVKVKEDMTGWIMAEHGVPESRLIVINQADDYISPSGIHYAMWNCKCNCGNENIITLSGAKIKNGTTKSCGCLQQEIRSKTHKKYNTYDMSGEFGIGYTNNNDEFWFDKEDYDLIKNYCWAYTNNGYLSAEIPNSNKRILLHRLVMGVVDPKNDVDHKKHPDGNQHKIDNRKENLRIVTRSNNMMNSAVRRNNKSGTSGVYFDYKNKKWVAQIMINKKSVFLGRFFSKDDAVEARRQAEIKYFGEYRYDANN